MKPTKKELAMVPKSPRKKGIKPKRINAPKGTLVGWKWAKKNQWLDGYVLVKIIIPAWADVIRHESCKKLRTSHAVVVGAWETESVYIKDKRKSKITNKPHTSIITSNHDRRFQYKVGDVLKPMVSIDNPRGKLSLNQREDCAPGIHFFLTKQPALDRSYG